MSALHPHWQADEGADVPVRDSSPVPTEEEVTRNPSRIDISPSSSIRPASRMPAAVVGILIVATVCITSAGGWEAIRGQLAQVGGGAASSAASSKSSTSSIPKKLAAVEIHIVARGFSPEIATVQPGQQITWINDQAFPHILTSATLRNDSGAFLNTAAVFPKGKVSFTVGKNEPAKEHTYDSTTDPTLHGKIVVTGADGQVAAAAASSTRDRPLGSLDDVPLPTGQGTRSASSVKTGSSASSAKSGTPVVAAGSKSSTAGTIVPVTVSGATLEQHAAPAVVPPPLAATTVPTVIVQDINDLPPVDMMDIAPLSPEPFHQPDTGPEVWVAVALSIGALVWYTRKMFMLPGQK